MGKHSLHQPVSKRGHGALRNFKNVRLEFPAERQRWFQFKRERIRQRVRGWLEAHEIPPL